MTFTKRLKVPHLLCENTREDIERTMLDGDVLDMPSGEVVGGSGLFPHYMRLFEHLQPDAVFLTARSAIPVADSIRGYCDGRGINTPPLYRIEANMDLSHAVFTDNEYYSDSHDEQVQREIKRIRPLSEHIKTAMVVDQYIHMGYTLRLARRILRQAGIAPVISTMDARWYEQAHLSWAHVSGMTSDMSEAMYQIGQHAASCSSPDFSETIDPRVVARYQRIKSL